MADENTVAKLALMKRKRKTERTNVTKFTNEINKADSDTTVDHEYIRGRLQDALGKLTVLDDSIHDLLSDTEYDADVVSCEEYVDSAKRAILRASRIIENLTTSAASLTLGSSAAALSAPSPVPTTYYAKPPPIRLEPFAGDVEKWARFWEQFQSSVDQNPSINVIDKHVFLRGYLEGEPRDSVEGIAITADTYEETKRILIGRYGDKNRIIQAHLDYIEALKPIPHATPYALNVTYIECNRRIQALKALGEKVDDYGRVLAPKLLRAFPDDICRRWIIHAKRERIPEGHITKLMEFLYEEVEGALTTSKIRGDSASLDSYTPTAATLQVNTKPERKDKRTKRRTSPFCAFCESRDHWAQGCTKVTDVAERIEKLKSSQRCFLCLNRGHNSRDCSKKGSAACVKCKKPHHVAICNERQQTDVSVGTIDVGMPDFTYLQTARIRITGPTGLTKLTRCILDAGSQSSFVCKNLADQLMLDVIGRKDLAVTAFEALQPRSRTRRLIRLNVSGIWTKSVVCINAFESENKYSSHPAVPHAIQHLPQIRKLRLADPKDDAGDLPIEVLIGGDQYWKIVKDEPPIRLSHSVVLLPSKFGWILSGNKSGTTVNNVSVGHISTNEEFAPSDDSMRLFWDLETLGIREQQPRALSAKDSTILEDFHNTFRLADGRRVVSLPRKENVVVSSNLRNAEKRFQSLQRKLDNDEEFSEMYYAHMTDYIEKGHVEQVATTESTPDVFYLPHHAVKKQRHGATKWRIVFDASSRDTGSPSLNGALEMGPNLLPEILSTLLRFRTHRRALIGDGTQAFLQLHLDERDRDLTRFLWFRADKQNGNWSTTDDVISYRFTRLPFGLTCSPFLLSATLRELATRSSDKYPTAAKLLDKSTFMDDFAASAEDDSEAITIYYEMSGMLRQIKMPMAKWATNSVPLQGIWEAEGREIKREVRVLGVGWSTESDSLVFDHRDITDKLSNEPATKRAVLQAIARFYDPLGLLSPVSMAGKILFQDTWCRGLHWDEILPRDIAERWQLWTSTLCYLSSTSIPRWLGLSNQPPEDPQVHVFCDASERAYGATLYVRTLERNEVSVQLACSKNRLSPIKKVTLPRLELLAALTGSRLLRYFCESTGHNITKATLWSDSMVALGWIRNDPNKWKTFVSNRVTEIQGCSNPTQWRHCPGEDNPADLLSRGLLANDLQGSDLWWHGPQWLVRHPDNWPRNTTAKTPLPEAKKTNLQVLVIDAWESPIDAGRYSSYLKALRVMSWVLRFMTNASRADKLTGEPTTQEIEAARLRWIRVVQQESFAAEHRALMEGTSVPTKSKIFRYNPFLEDGLIRLGGRLEHADLPPQEKHPLLLDGSHPFTKLLIRHTHVRIHHLGVRIVLSELRHQFWILKARQSIKKILHTCLPCKIANNRRGQEVEAPLPSDRVRPTKPFVVTGVDFAGPLYIKVGRETRKAYIVLFTCATTRALHLELSSDMSTERFLMAFRRFSGRRGLPHTMYSDNATTFQAANRELTELSQILTDPQTSRHFAHNGVRWKFIAPRAAWWGGWWERMVGTTKRCLRKVLGKSHVDEESLGTILVEIEAAINSRPILQDGPDTLTPSHFLNGERLTTLPTGPEPTVNMDLREQKGLREKLQDDFLRRWKREYLLGLRSYHEVRRPDGRAAQCRIGDVVLLQDDVRPRHMWRQACVTGTRPGRDGKVRTLTLRTSNGATITRPVQLVIPLEIDQGGEDVEDRRPR